MLPPPDPEELLRSYGLSFTLFAGTLVLRGGAEQDWQTFEGRLWGAQLHSGRLVLACLLTSFHHLRAGGEMLVAEGMLDDGSSFTTEGPLTWMNTLSDDFGWDRDPRGTWVVLNARAVVIGDAGSPEGHTDTDDAFVTSAAPVAERRYTLTNLAFEGTRRAEPDDAPTSGLDLKLGTGVGEEVRWVLLRRVPDYRAIMRRVGTLRSTEVTAELIVRDPRDPATDDALVGDLTYVLSVARGTKVQWLSREDRAADGRTITKHLRAHVTKPFASHAIIDVGAATTRAFLEEAFPIYLQRREAYDLRATIDGMLDGKAEADFLEMRGVKLAIALETVKNSYARSHGWQAEFLIEPDAYLGMVPALHAAVKAAFATALQEQGLSKKLKSTLAMKGKMHGFNRRNFKDLLDDVFRDIGLEVPAADFELLIASRNSLVHRGRFYHHSATPEEAERVSPPGSDWEEFSFLVDVVDRLFLKLLGHSGTFISHRHGSRVPALLS